MRWMTDTLDGSGESENGAESEFLQAPVWQLPAHVNENSKQTQADEDLVWNLFKLKSEYFNELVSKGSIIL